MEEEDEREEEGWRDALDLPCLRGVLDGDSDPIGPSDQIEPSRSP